MIIDEESVSVDAETLIEAIRRAPGGVDAEIVLLTRGIRNDVPRLVELGARRLPKPLNMRALESVIGRMGARVAERGGAMPPRVSARRS